LRPKTDRWPDILAGSTRSFDEVVREQLAYLASVSPGSAGAAGDAEAALQNLRRGVPQSYWEDFDAYRPLETAAQLDLPMLILQGERDYQVTLADLEGWRGTLGGRANVTVKTYPALNHLFLPGEGKSTPAEYAQPGRIPDVVLDDIAGWITSH
jgi:hypothetical protein